MALQIFLSQRAIDRGVESGRFDLDGDLLKVATAPPCQFFINPGVYFVSLDVDTGMDDPNQLIGRTKSVQELAQLGADHYENSVVLGDCPYTVQSGYLATSVDAHGTPNGLSDQLWSSLLPMLRHLG